MMALCVATKIDHVGKVTIFFSDYRRNPAGIRSCAYLLLDEWWTALYAYEVTFDEILEEYFGFIIISDATIPARKLLRNTFDI